MEIPIGNLNVIFRCIPRVQRMWIKNIFYNNSYDRKYLEVTTLTSTKKVPNIILSNNYTQQTYNVSTILKSTF